MLGRILVLSLGGVVLIETCEIDGWVSISKFEG